MWSGLHVAFLVVVPVTIDRSISTFLLGELNSASLTKQELVETLIRKYVQANDAVGRRIAEQITSKNIEWSGEKLVLTEQGKSFMSFATAVGRIYGVK